MRDPLRHLVFEKSVSQRIKMGLVHAVDSVSEKTSSGQKMMVPISTKSNRTR